MNAWLLTWEGTEGPALVPNKKIIAILSSRRSLRSVEDLVDVLYCRSVDSAYDIAFLANKRKAREHQYRHLYSNGGRLFYGRNPCIFARQVADLTVQRGEHRRTELIRWTELAVFQNAESGSGIVEVEPSRAREHFRKLEPLGRDVYPREA